jgi:hypothetical protein
MNCEGGANISSIQYVMKICRQETANILNYIFV